MIRHAKFGIASIGVLVVSTMVLGGVWAMANDSKDSVTGDGSVTGLNTQSAAVFSDTTNHWAEKAIQAAVDLGIVKGYEDGTFRPDQTVTRAEFTKMVVAALKLPVGTPGSGDSWYSPYINEAVSAGVHQWSDFTAGDWNTPMSRLEMSRMGVRAVGEKNDDAKKWMYLATQKGLIRGMDATGTLAADGTTTRAQAVAVIERVLDVKGGKTLEVDKHAISRAEVLWHKTNIFTLMPQYFGKIHPSSKWDPDDLFYQTDDGKYRGEMDALLAIDLQDPNDPFLSELPPLNTLKVYNGESIKTSSYLQKPELMQDYVLYAKGHEVYNYDTSLYNHYDYLPLSIVGQEGYNGEMHDGQLQSVTTLLKDGKYINAFLVPKKLKTEGDLFLEVYPPKVGDAPNKTILRAMTPELIQ